MTLGPEDHDRAAAGLAYVYPVVSRRAEGVSVGVNLNPNDACNWRCVYCQVPGLIAGNAPKIDLELLEVELREFLDPKVLNQWLADVKLVLITNGSLVHRDIGYRWKWLPTSRSVILAMCSP